MTQKSKQTPNKESISGLLLKSLQIRVEAGFYKKGRFTGPPRQATQAGGMEGLGEFLPERKVTGTFFSGLAKFVFDYLASINYALKIIHYKKVMVSVG
jgi:hypothetical protein